MYSDNCLAITLRIPLLGGREGFLNFGGSPPVPASWMMGRSSYPSNGPKTNVMMSLRSDVTTSVISSH